MNRIVKHLCFLQFLCLADIAVLDSAVFIATSPVLACLQVQKCPNVFFFLTANIEAREPHVYCTVIRTYTHTCDELSLSVSCHKPLLTVCNPIIVFIVLCN